MKLLSRLQPAKFLGVQCPPVDHTRNSWVYSQQSCNHYMTVVLCTWLLPGYSVTFVHVLTYLPTSTTLSKMSNKEEDHHAVLQYADVPKIKESEALLVQNSSKRLEEYGLTLWVVSIVLYIQESQA